MYIFLIESRKKHTGDKQTNAHSSGNGIERPTKSYTACMDAKAVNIYCGNNGRPTCCLKGRLPPPTCPGVSHPDKKHIETTAPVSCHHEQSASSAMGRSWRPLHAVTTNQVGCPEKTPNAAAVTKIAGEFRSRSTPGKWLCLAF